MTKLKPLSYKFKLKTDNPKKLKALIKKLNKLNREEEIILK